MNTSHEYVKQYGRFTFQESPFNEVDNAVFSSLAYLDFSDCIDDEEEITIRFLARRYFKKNNTQKIRKNPHSIRQMIETFFLCSTVRRYQDIIVHHFRHIINETTQFQALCFTISKGTMFVAFEGTDDSMVGWHEDFDMMHTFPIPSQKLAMEYLNQVITRKYHRVYVGGHSKGGNLAMTACMYLPFWKQHKVKQIYNNDGPGFRKEEYESKEFKRIEKKLHVIIPESSVIGLLFYHKKDFQVVKSLGRGIYQHDLSNWLCYGAYFTPGTLTDEAKSQARRFSICFQKYSYAKKKEFVNILFSLFKECNMTVFSEVTNPKISKLIRLIHASRKLDKESKELLIDMFSIVLNNKVASKNETIAS